MHKKTLLKLKGVILTRKAFERVNFDSVKELVEGFFGQSPDNIIQNSPREHRTQ